MPTLLDVARFVADNFITGQFVEIDGEDFTPSNIEDFRQETRNLFYSELPRHTGARSGDPEKTFLADPDLGENLDNEDPFDDKFLTLAGIKDSSSEEFVVPFVQAGDYFGFELDSDAHTVQFGATGFGQDVTYNILNLVEGSNDNDNLNGTEGNDYIDGKNGKDTLTGLGGDDLMLGGNDKDTIDGGTGDDELWGEEGNDVFIYGSGYEKDKIFDFEPGEIIKLVRFEEFEEEEFEDSIIDITLPSGVNAAQITFNDKDILHIVGVSKNDLEIDDGKITFDD